MQLAKMKKKCTKWISKLVVHLVAGMKEQQTQIDALQSEINNLKG